MIIECGMGLQAFSEVLLRVQRVVGDGGDEQIDERVWCRRWHLHSLSKEGRSSKQIPITPSTLPTAARSSASQGQSMIVVDSWVTTHPFILVLLLPADIADHLGMLLCATVARVARAIVGDSQMAYDVMSEGRTLPVKSRLPRMYMKWHSPVITYSSTPTVGKLRFSLYILLELLSYRFQSVKKGVALRIVKRYRPNQPTEVRAGVDKDHHGLASERKVFTFRYRRLSLLRA